MLRTEAGKGRREGSLYGDSALSYHTGSFEFEDFFVTTFEEIIKKMGA